MLVESQVNCLLKKPSGQEVCVWNRTNGGMGLRIAGLVRVLNEIRAEMQAGIAPGEKAAFIERVQRVCQRVEQICAQNGTTPAQLPAPSRRVYEFLKNLDSAQIPLRSEDASVMPAKQGNVRIINLNKGIEQVMAQVWMGIWRTERSFVNENQVRTLLEQQQKGVEELMARDEFGVVDLTEGSRQAYCWLRFILSEDHLQEHLSALNRAAFAARSYISANKKIMVDLTMTNMRSAWRFKMKPNLCKMTCSEGFLYAPEEVWAALMGYAFARKTDLRMQIIRGYIDSEEFSAVLFEIEAFGATRDFQTEGHVHNLDESFERVNRAYFGGTMAKPALHWNQVLTARKFGHYMPSRDTVMISITLDSPQVPAYIVDFVMYHELLHKKHGVRIVAGRRLSHTPAFRAEERLFAQFEEANSFLNELARTMG